MSLSDPRYFLLLGLTFLLFYIFRAGAPRRLLLLAASYFFYFELRGGYVLILLYVTLVTYGSARLLRSVQVEKRRALLFWLSVVVVLIPLLLFKYALILFPHLPWSNLMLGAFPIGISFFTFAALGYLIDVSLEVVEPESDFNRVALFLAFFPLVSAGPIERTGRLMPQLDLDTRFSADRSLAALRLILIGLVLKLFIASFLQLPSDQVFAVPTNYQPIEKLCGVIYYAFTMYTDFAGYSLIAIGSAQLFGLEVRPNFQQPFLSASIPEYWRNWHISLSSWVRDYLFVPLRMELRRYPSLGMTVALLFSFAIIGVWHGATWGYLIFGLMHGFFVTVSAFTLARRDAFWKSVGMPPRMLHVLRVVVTFSLVLIAFVVFRAKTLGDAMIIYQGIFSFELLHNIGQTISYALFHQGQEFDFRLAAYPFCWALIAVVVTGDILVRNRITFATMPRLLQGVFYYLGIMIVLYEWLTEYVAAPFQYYKF